MRKKIFVTGGSGFVGSALVKRLAMIVDYKVTVLSRNFMENKLDYYGDRVDYITGDLETESSFLDKELNDIDVVIHLASEVDIQKSLEAPRSVLVKNSEMLLVLLETCRRKNGKKPLCIFASTDRVYGKISDDIVDENAPIYPIEPYTASKMYGEILLELYYNLYGIPYLIFRFDSIYGPRQPERMFISDVIRKIMETSNIEVGDLNVRKNFVYIEDVVEAFILGIESRSQAQNTIYNIGGERASISTALNGILDYFENTFDKKVTVVQNKKYNRNSETEVMGFGLSIEKVKHNLGWSPKIDLITGLQKTINYFYETK